MLWELILTAFGQSDPSGSSHSHTVAVPDVVRHMPVGTRQRDLLPSLQRLASTSMDLTALDRPNQIQPLRTFSIADGRIHFTLDPALRELLSRTKRDRYGHLDLARARTFGSGYTLPVFRHLVALHGPNPLPRTTVQQVSYKDISRITTFRPQRTGGFRGQIDRVLSGIKRDFDRDPTALRIDLRWKDDAGRFLDAVEITTTSPLPDLRRLRSRALDKTYKHELEAIVRPDAEPFAVSMSGWAKVAGLVRLRDPQPVLQRLSDAFDLAIDEVVRLDDQDFAPLRTTEAGFATSPVRGARLRDLIDREGIDRATVLFALHELREPDFSSDLARDLAVRTHLVRRAREAREARHVHGPGWKGHRPASKAPWMTPDEIEEHIADRLLIAEEARRREADLLASRLAGKLAGMERSREGRNARRRSRRAEAKGDLPPLEELRPRERRRIERERVERVEEARIDLDPRHEDDEVDQGIHEEIFSDDILVEHVFDDGPSTEEIERMQRAPQTDHSKIPF